MASQLTGVLNVYSTVCSGANQWKPESSASQAFVRVIHRWRLNSPQKVPVRRKILPSHDVIMVKAKMYDWWGGYAKDFIWSYCQGSCQILKDATTWTSNHVVLRLRQINTVTSWWPQITSLTIVYSTVYLGADQKKHQTRWAIGGGWLQSSASQDGDGGKPTSGKATFYHAIGHGSLQFLLK